MSIDDMVKGLGLEPKPFTARFEELNKAHFNAFLIIYSKLLELESLLRAAQSQSDKVIPFPRKAD